jgi:hypothetical protein
MVGAYDERLEITLDPTGYPIVEARGAETQTFVVKEPADDDRVWAFETLTKVVNEPADDDRTWAFETQTRVLNEPADDDHAWLESLKTGLPPVDDCASGLVSF